MDFSFVCFVLLGKVSTHDAWHQAEVKVLSCNLGFSCNFILNLSYHHYKSISNQEKLFKKKILIRNKFKDDLPKFKFSFKAHISLCFITDPLILYFSFAKRL